MLAEDMLMQQGATALPQAGGWGGGGWRGGGDTGGGSWGGWPGQGGGDTNPQGAAADPFGYTGGSLLTPWEGRFSSSGYGGGYSVPDFQAFNYADFGYDAPKPGRFEEKYQDPAAFRFADFQGPSAFKAPTAEDMQADPGYQARMDAVSKAQTAQAANQGTMRTGGFQKGLAQAVGNQASQEYGNTYNRRASEWDRNWGQAKDTYGINQGNTKQAFDTNTANRLAGHQTRQNDWSGNANVALQEGQLGYNIAQGTWDRNMAKARQGYDDEQQYRNSVASAASASANQSYERDLGDYNRARDEFWTNQDRQSALLDNEDRKMMDMTSQYGNQMMGGYGRMGDYSVGAGDARASGYQGAGNAAAGGWSNAGNAVSQGLGYAAVQRGFGAPPKPAGGQQPGPRMPQMQQPQLSGVGGSFRPSPFAGFQQPNYGGDMSNRG